MTQLCSDFESSGSLQRSRRPRFTATISFVADEFCRLKLRTVVTVPQRMSTKSPGCAEHLRWNPTPGLRPCTDNTPEAKLSAEECTQYQSHCLVCSETLITDTHHLDSCSEQNIRAWDKTVRCGCFANLQRTQKPAMTREERKTSPPHTHTNTPPPPSEAAVHRHTNEISWTLSNLVSIQSVWGVQTAQNRKKTS